MAKRMGFWSTMMMAAVVLSGCVTEPEPPADDDDGGSGSAEDHGGSGMGNGQSGNGTGNGDGTGNGLGTGNGNSSGAGGGSSTPPTTSNGDQSATLHVQNNSSYPVFYLYVSPCGSDSWGGDQLAENVISAGQAFNLNGIPDGCYDFLAEAPDGYWDRYGTQLGAGQTFDWSLNN